MARPPLKGLQYYPMDTDTWQDRKIRKLCKTHGAVGKCVYDYITAMCYREHGYFMPWDKNLYFDVADMMPFPHMSEEIVETVVQYCLEVELFNAQVFSSDKVLTSKGIQKRYIYACRVSNRRAYGILEPMCLLSPADEEIRAQEIIPLIEGIEVVHHIFSDIMPVSSEKMEISDEQSYDLQAESTQIESKVKESKIKEKKVWVFTPPSLEDVIAFFVENGHSEDLARHAFKYYSTPDASGRAWIDSNQKPVKNWKQKMIAVWFKSDKFTAHKHKQNEQSKGDAIANF